MVNCLYGTSYRSKKVSAKLLYPQVHDETTVTLTKKRNKKPQNCCFRKRKVTARSCIHIQHKQISFIIWDDKLQVKLAWNSWWEMPHKGGQGFLQSVAAPNDGTVSFKKDMIFLACCIIICYVNKYEMWGPLCLKSIDIAGIIFEEGRSIIPSGFVSIQHIFTLWEAPIALSAEKWNTEWFVALWDGGGVLILAKSVLVSWWVVPSHCFSAFLRTIAKSAVVLSLLWFDLFSALFPSLCT